MNNLIKLYAVLFSAIIVSIIYIFFSINSMQKELNENIEQLFISQASDFAKNIDRKIHKAIVKDIKETLKRDKLLRDDLEEELSLFITPIYKYIFVLYRDNNGDYRFLLDGSLDDKAEFHQKLAVEKDQWDKVYQTKQPQIFKHKESFNLWVTYLRPILYNGDIKGVIAIDFSVNLRDKIEKSILPINQIFIYIFVAIGIILLILLYQTVLNIKTKRESVTDPLTQVYNRNYLREFLKKMDLSNYQIMMLDIDFFKKINDNYGHKAGDLVLQGVAKVLQESIRYEDVLIRYGGEEFLIFIKRKTIHSHAAKKVAKRIREKLLLEKFVFNDMQVQITLSIGLNCHPERFKKVSDAIKYADEMLYVAKRTGRDKIVETNETFSRDKKLSIYEVKEALEENRIQCFYQPIYNTKTKKIEKYEALVRLIDKENNFITPNYFLENIQNTNIYSDITKRVIHNTFAKIQEKNITISINLNFSDINNTTIFQMIIELLEENKIYAPYLVIELLENEWLEDVAILNQRLDILKSYGVKIAIDDFGSGYSNFYILTHLHIDIVKIDGTLIKDVATNKVLYQVSKSIITLVNELGLETIAEMVHSKEVYDIVKEFGVDNVQGFYFSKPLQKI